MVICTHPEPPADYNEWLHWLGNAEPVRCEVCGQWIAQKSIPCPIRGARLDDLIEDDKLEGKG